jgi:hypothetical protein
MGRKQENGKDDSVNSTVSLHFERRCHFGSTIIVGLVLVRLDRPALNPLVAFYRFPVV